MITRNNLTGDHRKHDTALRHKIRNLRAKVRLLLPMDLCCKEQRRSKNLIKMDHNRRLEMASHQHRWNFSKENMSELYVPDHPPPLEKHLFEKLTSAELEQIKEDKLYYVGEEFLDQFDQFLEMREKQKSKNSLHPKIYKGYSQLQSIPDLNHKSSLSVGEDGSLREKQNTFETRMKHLMRMQGIQAKRKLITEEDTTRRAYIKIKGREKQERHLQNYVRAFAEKEESIRQRNKANMIRTAQSLKRKNNCLEVGEICELSEKLRNLCLMRQSKSAKLVCRE